MLVWELSGCEFESRWCHLNFRYGACFGPEFLDIQANYKVWTHSETCTWHDNNIDYRRWVVVWCGKGVACFARLYSCNFCGHSRTKGNENKKFVCQWTFSQLQVNNINFHCSTITLMYSQWVARRLKARLKKIGCKACLKHKVPQK